MKVDDNLLDHFADHSQLPPFRELLHSLGTPTSANSHNWSKNLPFVWCKFAGKGLN